MARTGIYKSDVLRARNSLLAKGRHPSIDAVRIELGNTGSKGTIHKHLRELDEEEAGQDFKANASGAIQDLVARLAERLKQEAQERVYALEARHAEQVAELEEQIRLRDAELAAARKQIGQAETALAQEKAQRQQASEQAARLALEVAQLTTEVAGLRERGVETQAHIASLEEKHQHAREALEHFRTSAKDQRDRELRQHEQQVQYLQSELGKANAALADKQLELRAALQEKVDTITQLQAVRAETRQLEERVRELKPLPAQMAGQAQVIEQLRDQARQLGERADEARARSTALEQHNRELERQLVAANAVVQAKDQLLADALTRLAATPSGHAGASIA